MIMVIDALLDFIRQPFMSLFIGASIFLCAASFSRWRTSHDIRFAYSHLFFLLFPFILFGASLPCTMDLISGVMTLCSIALTKTIFFLIPAAIFLTLLSCFIIGPRLYLKLMKAVPLKHTSISRFMENQARKIPFPIPHLYCIPDCRPTAFSFRGTTTAIVVSQGFLDRLHQKEQEAVLLHEIGHIKHKSSFAKTSAMIINAITPFARFSPSSNLMFSTFDEKRADHFAITIQGTDYFLESARKKFGRKQR